MPHYNLTWLDSDDAHIITEDIFKQSMQHAIRYAARRMVASSHSLPKNCCGFFLSWESLNDKLQEPENI